MKKIALLVAVLTMVLSLSIMTMADGTFVQSPSLNGAPEISDAVNENEECTAHVFVTAYRERESLAESQRAELETAYKQISEAEDLSTLNTKLKDFAEELFIAVDELSVADLFDIRCDEDCTNHESHGAFQIQLTSVTLQNFVALLHFNGTEWEVVEGATLNEAGILEFSIDDFSPFAVIVFGEGSGAVANLSTGNVVASIGIGVGAGAAAFGLMYLFVWLKKRKA